MKEFTGFVRIISFSEKASQFKATIENIQTKEKVKCDLQFVRNISNSIEINHPRLFQCDLSKSEFNYRGTNKLTIEGDLEQTIEFNVDKPLKVSEKHNVLFVSFGFIVGISLAIIYHVFLVLVIFIPFDFEYIKDYKNHQLFSILAGPLVTGYRLKKLELWAKIIFPFLVLLPIVFPVGFFPSGDDNGIITFWGYLFYGKFTWDTFLVGFGSLYFFTIAISIEEIFIVVLTKWNFSYLVDLIVSAVLYAIALYGWYYFGIEVSYGARWFASFPFFVFPFVAIVLASIYRPLKKRRKIGLDRSSLPSQTRYTSPLL